jgi:hypothetical protein
MPNRIVVPGPEPQEEARQLAEAVSDMHYVSGTIVEAATELVPGESVDELRTAWFVSEPSLRELVSSLYTVPPVKPPISPDTLVKSELTGEIGKIKRSTLGRLRDRFFMFWNSEPRDDEKRMKAADAADDYLEYCGTVIESIPGYERVVELVSLIKQLIRVRSKRGH